MLPTIVAYWHQRVKSSVITRYLLAKVGIGTLKVSRYRYSVLAPKSNSVPVLGTPFKMYRLTFAVPVLFEKNVQYQSSTIGGKKK